jgi:hypothetical protein
MPQQGKKHADQPLLLALACGATVENAARQSGVSESTAYRRLADAEFREQLQKTRAEMTERSVAMLTAAGMEAVKTLVALQQGATPPAVRLGAARSVLELGIKLREAVNLEERLTALEQQMAQGQSI